MFDKYLQVCTDYSLRIMFMRLSHVVCRSRLSTYDCIVFNKQKSIFKHPVIHRHFGCTEFGAMAYSALMSILSMPFGAGMYALLLDAPLLLQCYFVFIQFFNVGLLTTNSFFFFFSAQGYQYFAILLRDIFIVNRILL